MNYLVDTNVVSEIRKGERADPLVIDWFRRRRPQDVFLSVLTVGELRRGVRRIQRRDSKAASVMEVWLDRILDRFRDRVLDRFSIANPRVPSVRPQPVISPC